MYFNFAINCIFEVPFEIDPVQESIVCFWKAEVAEAPAAAIPKATKIARIFAEAFLTVSVFMPAMYAGFTKECMPQTNCPLKIPGTVRFSVPKFRCVKAFPINFE